MESIQNPARVMKNPWAEKVIEMEGKGASLEELVPFISGKLSSTGWGDGNYEEGLYPAGQVAGRIRDIPSVDDLVKRIIEEATEVKDKLNDIL